MSASANLATNMNPVINTATTIQEAVSVAAQIEPADGVCEISRYFLAGHHLMQPNDVDRVCDQERRANKNGVVTGLIAPRSVSVLIGDSGIGKSPLAYQLGLCVAAGVPFLGMPTQEGLVVYADYENPIEESRELRDRQVSFLELPIAPDNFLLWTPDSGDSLDIEGICSDVKPAMFIIDSLRSHNPQFEKSENAGEAMKRLNTIARTYGTAILAIHHIRKPGEVGVPLLDSEDREPGSPWPSCLGNRRAT
jgi:predicted ATP-dependent serine protease